MVTSSLTPLCARFIQYGSKRIRATALRRQRSRKNSNHARSAFRQHSYGSAKIDVGFSTSRAVHWDQCGAFGAVQPVFTTGLEVDRVGVL